MEQLDVPEIRVIGRLRFPLLAARSGAAGDPLAGLGAAEQLVGEPLAFHGSWRLERHRAACTEVPWFAAKSTKWTASGAFTRGATFRTVASLGLLGAQVGVMVLWSERLVDRGFRVRGWSHSGRPPENDEVPDRSLPG